MQITISGQIHNYDASPGEIAGLGLARAHVMDALPPGKGQDNDTPLSERPGYVGDDIAYLEGIVQAHCERTGEDPLAVMTRCLRSWSTDGPPEPELEPLSPEAQRAALVSYAAQRRWQKETGGCSWGLHQVRTDRDSQAKLIAEFVAIQAGVRPDPSPWKFADGFALVSNMDMGAVILAVRAHIAAVFAKEAEIVSGIEAGTITDTATIDALFAK